MRFPPSLRRNLLWWLSGLGLLAACTAAPTATPTPPTETTVPLGEMYTHPSAAFSLPVPQGWQVVREDEVSVRLEPGPDLTTDKVWLEMMAIHTGVPLNADALRTFSRQFALDYCPVPDACEVHRARNDDPRGAQIAVGVHYEPEGQEALHIRLTFQQDDAVVYVLTTASRQRGVLRDFQEALWPHIRLATDQATTLPLYGYRRTAVFPIHANHPEQGPYLKVPVPAGWGLNQTSEVREDYYYSYALAMSPDGHFGLSVYIGHPHFSAATLRQDAIDTLAQVFHFEPAAFTLAHQHRDMEGRWVLNWEATPPGVRATTLAAIHDDELVLITGMAKPDLWPLAEPCFAKVLQTYRVDEQP